MRRYLVEAGRVVRELAPGERATVGQVLRTARAVMPSARVCKVPTGARPRADLYLHPVDLARVLRAAGGLSVRAWVADALASADLATLRLRLLHLDFDGGVTRTSLPLIVTDARHAELLDVAKGVGLPLQSVARMAIEVALERD